MLHITGLSSIKPFTKCNKFKIKQYKSLSIFISIGYNVFISKNLFSFILGDLLCHITPSPMLFNPINATKRHQARIPIMMVPGVIRQTMFGETFFNILHVFINPNTQLPCGTANILQSTWTGN